MWYFLILPASIGDISNYNDIQETWRLQDDFIEVIEILVGLKDVYVTVFMLLQSGLHGHPCIYVVWAIFRLDIRKFACFCLSYRYVKFIACLYVLVSHCANISKTFRCIYAP